MNIKLSDHFDYKRLLRFALPSIIMMIFTSIYCIVDGFFVSNYAGKTAFAAVNLIMPLLLVLGCVGFMFGTGGGALIAKTMGERKQDKANEIFTLIITVSVLCGVVLAVLGFFLLRPVAEFMGAEGELFASPLGKLFVGYDDELLEMTVHAFSIFSFSFLFSVFSIYGSSFFTALNDGLTSAMISFLRTLVFQLAAVLLFPLIWELDGIWLSIVGAEVMSITATVLFLIGKRKRYGY